MKVRAPSANSRYFDVKKLIHGQSLHTICEEARCPNIAECWGRGTATFQILGDTCTAACRYCYVHSGKPEHPPDPLEPLRLAKAAAEMGLKHVVVTSVDRDDVADRGAGHYAATIRALKAKLPEASVEVLTPDFLGVEEEALRTVLAAQPEVFNHNIETVRRLHARMRGAKASYDKALWLLAREGARGLPRADEVRDHRRAGGDERRGRRDDGRPPRPWRRRRHDRPIPAAEREAREDRPLGASGRVPPVPRAG
jgi:lipoate synthase